uniref:MYB transcription factor n=1 Tax=Pyramimonas obovata TaxID=1411642 RepID=A0A6T7V0Y7_9CHLO|eukprot:CAMPEP_0118931630 /NCGR_PEP_ID=MMETSP1169-20130426/7903_1 /TAXON_ID=36882 /ORGANISM="Pyramimonas obovata, Strain CCMP722" /LENGTH=325 /DNA_ID=CAMNT_0006874151 /DNA_START=54 /DNA_END=1031 /DNA_ORIENTATION=-
MSGGKGIPKTKWSEEEEAALKAGVERYGAGKWRFIQKDEEFQPILCNRSNVDLKDKWRNLNCAPGATSPKAATPAAAKTPVASTPTPTKPASTEKTLSKRKLEQLVIEAVTALKEKNGSSTSAIAKYIEDHLEAGTKLASNFKTKVLVDALASLSESGKLVKVKSLYKLPEAKPAVTPKAKAKAEKAEPPAPATTPATASKGRKAAKTPSAIKSRSSTKRAPPTPASPAAPAEEPTMALTDIKSKIEKNKTQVAEKGKGSRRKGQGMVAAELALEAALAAVVDAEECKRAAEEAAATAIEAEREAADAERVADAAAQAVLSGKSG